MGTVLVNSDVLLDILTSDKQWSPWSTNAVLLAGDANRLVINPIIFAEISIRFTRIEELDDAVRGFEREAIPFEAAFLAGKAFAEYRRRKGAKRSPLPDFFIGAHAAIADYSLLTRDPARYRSYFPTVCLIAPET